MASWWTVSLRLVPLVLLFSHELAVSRPICVPMLLINPLQHPIDMFNPDNFGAGLKVEMDCSRLMGPEVTVTVEPTLQAELISREAVNKKVSVGYQCSGGVEYNVTTTLRTMPPWFTVLNGLQRPLNLGDECNLFGCYWYENASNRYTAVAWALKTTSCVIDYNECADGTAQCEHICTDIVNSYNCSCYDGYQLDQNGHNCSDIDECSTGEHLCSHTCTNTVGGYQCSCPVGFQIGGDNHTCMDKDASPVPENQSAPSNEAVAEKEGSPTEAADEQVSMEEERKEEEEEMEGGKEEKEECALETGQGREKSPEEDTSAAPKQQATPTPEEPMEH